MTTVAFKIEAEIDGKTNDTMHKDWRSASADYSASIAACYDGTLMYDTVKLKLWRLVWEENEDTPPDEDLISESHIINPETLDFAELLA